MRIKNLKSLPSFGAVVILGSIALHPHLALSQVQILPELSKSEPRLAALRQRFQAGDLANRRLDTFVDVKVPGGRKEAETIERIVHGYLMEVGAEPIGANQSRKANLRLEISSIQRKEQDTISQSVFMIVYDRSFPQEERPIMRSRTDLQCTFIYGKDYHTFAPPDATCIRDEKQLREAFLRMK